MNSWHVFLFFGVVSKPQNFIRLYEISDLEIVLLPKALSEKVMVSRSRNLNGTGTVPCGTRYGSVMASRDSVIPLFVDQIRAGKPLIREVRSTNDEVRSIARPNGIRHFVLRTSYYELFLNKLLAEEQGELRKMC